jgi:uncharacterized protein
MKMRRDLLKEKIPRNTGHSFELAKNQSVRISATTIIDLVLFNRQDLTERFDQARTKANQRKLFLTTGDTLISKLNNTMMTIVEDGFVEGHHDLQEGMCSRRRYELAALRGALELTYGRPMAAEDIPPHGCWENLSAVLTPAGISPVDIPSPFNLFQNMVINGQTGLMAHSPIRPTEFTGHVTLRAEMDLLVALSVCPDPIVGGTTGATLSLIDA